MTRKSFSFYTSLISCLILFLASLSVEAESPLTIDRYLSSQCHYSGTFEQKRRITVVPSPIISKGHFLYSCEHGLIWETVHPIRQSIIYTNVKKHFEINSKGHAKQLKGLIHQNMALFLISLMGGDREHIEELFFIEEMNHGNFDLIPRRSSINKHLRKINFKKRLNIFQISLENSDGERTTISIKSITNHQTVDLPQCENIFTSAKLSCEALFIPQLVAESLSSKS